MGLAGARGALARRQGRGSGEQSGRGDRQWSLHDPGSAAALEALEREDWLVIEPVARPSPEREPSL